MKRISGRALVVAAALLAVLAGSWLLVLLAGAGIPLDRFRVPLEAALSRTLGQSVSIAGSIAVRPTLGPAVIVHDLRMSGPPGTQGREWLRAGQLEARFGLLSLLRYRPEITRLQARDVTVYLVQADTGAGQSQPATRRVEQRRPEPGRLLQTALELSLQNVVLDYRAAAGAAPLLLVLEQVRGSVLPGQPLQLTVAGRLGQSPWHVDLTLPPPARLLQPDTTVPVLASVDLAGVRLQLQGGLASSAAGQAPALELELQGAWLPAAEIGTEPGIAGRLELRPGEHGRPQFGGELQLSGPALVRLVNQAITAPGMAGIVSAGAAMALPGWLEAVDAVLVVSVDDFANAPVSIRDTRLDLTLHNGTLDAPLEAVIAGVPFYGSVQLAAAGARQLVSLSLAATAVDAATLLHDQPLFAGVRGDVARIVLHVAVAASDGRGGRVPGFDAGLQVSGARLSYGHIEDGVPVQATLDELALSVAAGSDMTMTARGVLRNAPFALAVTGGRLETLLQEQAWPIDLHATGCGATLNAGGVLTARQGERTVSLNLEASGEQLGGLAPWLGVPACSAVPYTARGQLLLAKNIGRLQFLEAQLGATRLRGELDWSRDEQPPLLHAVLHVDTLYPADVAGLLALLDYTTGAEAASGLRFDVPLLPRPVVLANADLNLTVAQFSEGLVDIADVSFTGRLRDGVFQRAPFRARIGPRVLQGELDTSGTAAAVVFAAAADEAESGSLLDQLFSSAIQWAGNAGVLPLRRLFTQALSASAVEGCLSGDGAASAAGQR